MSNYVPAIGPKKCILCLIGEAPGKDEDIFLEPFKGAAGDMLNKNLHSTGISRQECYITNLCKYKPYGNDFSIFWQGTHPKPELLQLRAQLLNELEEIETNVFVTLGKNALWALTGYTQISKWRGSILSCTLPSNRIIKVIPTFHPAAILHQGNKSTKDPEKIGQNNPVWNYNSMTVALKLDLKRAKEDSSFPELNIPEPRLLIAPTKNDVDTYIAILATSKKDFCIDIETTPVSITCIGIGNSKDEAMCIPTIPSYWGSMRTLKSVLEGINYLCQQPIGKIGQNFTYDLQYLFRFFHIFPTHPWHDDMILQHSLYGELPKSLAYLASVDTRIPYYKDDLKVWNLEKTDDKKLWEYNCKDVCTEIEIFDKLLVEAKSEGVYPVYQFMMDLLEPLLYMMLRGVKLDEGEIACNAEKLYIELNQEIKNFRKIYPTLNYRSPKQLITLVESMGVPLIMKRDKKTGIEKATMDAKAIEKLASKVPSLQVITEIKQKEKLINDYLFVQRDRIDDRLKCSFNSTGAETGRLSSSESVFNCGTNLQNWPKRIRNIVVPDEGKMFTEVDLVGAEAVVVAYESEDPFLINLFEQGYVEPKPGFKFHNIHSFTWYLIGGNTEEEINADKEKCQAEGRDTESMYYKGKRLRHSSNYLATWVSVAEQLEVRAAEAKMYLQKMYDNSPCLTEWHRRVGEQLKRTRTITTPLGRKRIFFGRWGDQLLREAVAYIPQGTVADYLNLGLIRFYYEVCKAYKEIEIMVQVYDSVLVQHLPEQREFVRKELARCLTIPIKSPAGREYTIKTECKSGLNWRDLK